MRAPLEFLVVVKDTLRVRLAKTSWTGRVGAVVVVGCLVVGGALVALNGSGAERSGDDLQPGPGAGGQSGDGGGHAGGRGPDDAATALNLGVGRERAGGEVAAPGATDADDGAAVGPPVAEADTPSDGPGGPPAGTGQDGAAADPVEAPGPEGGSPSAPTSSTSTPPATSPSASTTTTTTTAPTTTTTTPSGGGGGGLLGGVLDLLLGHG